MKQLDIPAGARLLCLDSLYSDYPRLDGPHEGLCELCSYTVEEVHGDFVTFKETPGDWWHLDRFDTSDYKYHDVIDSESEESEGICSAVDSSNLESQHEDSAGPTGAGLESFTGAGLALQPAA